MVLSGVVTTGFLNDGRKTCYDNTIKIAVLGYVHMVPLDADSDMDSA